MKLDRYQRAGWLGADYRYVKQTASTNLLLLEAGARGARAGTVVVADEQTAGRGRLKRRWHAPAETSLLMSLLFRPPNKAFAYYALRIMMICGIALVEVTSQILEGRVRLKWPNDLIVERNPKEWYKLAGMLSEVGHTDGPLSEGQPNFLVVGIGLNVNIPDPHLLPLTDHTTSIPATSLLVESEHYVNRPQILDNILKRVEALCDRMQEGWDPRPLWASHLAWLGQCVQVVAPTDTVHGIAEGVDDEGALILRVNTTDTASERSIRRHFPVGDVSLRNSVS